MYTTALSLDFSLSANGNNSIQVSVPGHIVEFKKADCEKHK